MKRLLALVLIVLLSAVPFGASLAENFLPNGGFEQIEENGRPTGWYETAYRDQAGYSRICASQDQAHSGRYSVLVENASANDARMTCTVSVEPESLYRLSGYVLVETMEDTGNGANFAVEGLYSASEGLFDTDGQWQYLEWYGETGEDQTEVTIGVRVGGYSAESTGKAYFDDLSLERVDELPDGIIADLWYDGRDSGAVQQPQSAENSEPQKSTWLFIAVGLAFVLLCLWGISACDTAKEQKALALLSLTLAAAAAIRVWLALNVPGYSVDINCFRLWSLRMAETGPVGFYAPDYFCDYPPGFLLLLWPLGLLLNAIGPYSAYSLLVVKALPVFCDLAGALLLYAFARRRKVQPGMVVFLSAIYALNPAVLANGAAWGQVDSVLALLLLITVMLALDQKWRWAFPVFVISILIKPQALLYAPVGLAWIVLCLCRHRQKNQWRDLGMGIGLALLAACAIVIPFAAGQDQPLAWLLSLYSDTLASYPYATLNTANLYYLLGANWVSLEQQAPRLLIVLLMLLAVGAGLWLLLRQKSVTKRRWLGIACLALAAVLLILSFTGADYALFGYVMMAFAYVYVLICLCFDHNAGSLPFAMSLALLDVYVLGVKVHERYLFTALPLLLVCAVLSRDRRVLWLYTGLSFTTFVNTAIVLDNSILYGASMGHLNIDTLAINDALCVLNLLLLGYGLWIGMTGLTQSQPVVRKPPKTTAAQPTARYLRLLQKPRDARLHLNWKDYTVMGVVTLAYGVLAFTNLGSTVAPQTAWISTSSQEQVVFDLGQSQDFNVLYYAGVSYHDFSIAVSEDGQTWSQDYPCEMREGLCYRWNYAVESTQSDAGSVSYSSVPLGLTGRYLRLNAESAGLNLWKIVVRDMEGKNLPMTIVSHTGERTDVLDDPQPVTNLIDEGDTCVGEPGWYNGTYFDEIYHARTAYEHLHGQKPYETTHPPLGKLLMAAGIAIFGMTPFGWRFAGTLIGVLMLPALYLLAKQLTHKRGTAALSMTAFSLDLMHYTQTRIATIDSFPVFFILLSYLFMARYMQTDVFKEEEHPGLVSKTYLRTLVPLLLCGISMGLSIASKWIGIYSAVGLALLFFITLYRQWRVSYLASGLDQTDGRVCIARDFALKRILVTCLFCVLFFVMIPCVIYYLCYIPYLAPTGPVTIKRLIEAQQGMLSYHSTPGLGMDHPFQSPWWQWPLILKPMWFAQDKYEPAGYASTIMCMGNPFIYYLGALAMLAVLAVFVVRLVKLRFALSMDVDEQDDGQSILVVSIGFLAQYLPWVLVPRSMYMYHYFASVPFIILATMLCMHRIGKAKPMVRYGVMGALLLGMNVLLITQLNAPVWPFPFIDAAYCIGVAADERSRRKPLAKYGLPVLYVLLAAVFFVLFFPYASGWLTSTKWLDAMKWFSRLYY